MEVNKDQGVEILSYDGGKGLLTFNNKSYADLDNERKQKYMKTALKTIQGTGLNAQRKNKMYNFVASQDTTISSTVTKFSRDAKADTAGAVEVLSPFQRGFSTFLGVIALLTVMFLTLSILIDITYLVVPLVTIFADSKGDKTWFISQEAKHAKKVSDNSVGSKNFTSPTWQYLKARWVSVFVVVGLILLLVTGQIYNIVALVGNMFGF